jgi:hypothetical protein
MLRGLTRDAHVCVKNCHDTAPRGFTARCSRRRSAPLEIPRNHRQPMSLRGRLTTLPQVCPTSCRARGRMALGATLGFIRSRRQYRSGAICCNLPNRTRRWPCETPTARPAKLATTATSAAAHYLEDSYRRALIEALGLLAATLPCRHDASDTRYLLAAAAALKGHRKLGDVLAHLDCVCESCPRCGATVYPDELQQALDIHQ